VQPGLLLLLAFEVAVGVAAAWLGFTGRRRYARRYRVVAALCAVVITPLLVFTLHRQSRAVAEVARWGVTPHPATRIATGLPVNGRAGGSWSFVVDASPDSIHAFHRRTLADSGWTLALIHPTVLMFERDGLELMVSVRADGGASKVDYVIGPMPGSARP
jgi:hypothetical protein